MFGFAFVGRTVFARARMPTAARIKLIPVHVNIAFAANGGHGTTTTGGTVPAIRLAFVSRTVFARARMPSVGGAPRGHGYSNAFVGAVKRLNSHSDRWSLYLALLTVPLCPRATQAYGLVSLAAVLNRVRGL